MIKSIYYFVKYALLGNYADQIKFFNPYNESETMTAKIIPTNDGGAKLVDKTGITIRSYARARDAKRGAARLGFTI